METGVLQLQVRSCGTTFQLNCDKLTLAFDDLNGYERHFCSGAAAHSDKLLKPRLISFLTYLLSKILSILVLTNGV